MHYQNDIHSFSTDACAASLRVCLVVWKKILNCCLLCLFYMTQYNPKRSHFIVGLWWATGPTLSQYQPNFTPNYGVMISHSIFSVLFELIIVNWNPFQIWFSEVAPVNWHNNFIFRSHGWGVRARFEIFGCFLVFK